MADQSPGVNQACLDVLGLQPGVAFEDRALRSAERMAVLAEDGRWTYAQLLENARRIAARLRTSAADGHVGVLTGQGAAGIFERL